MDALWISGPIALDDIPLLAFVDPDEPAAGPSNQPEAGTEIITTACPSSFSAAINPPPDTRSGPTSLT